MTLFFERLSLEIRNQVYRELLVEEHGPLETDYHGYLYKTIKPLYPAILCTCKQAYQEASAVLYEQNHFRVKVVDCSLRCTDPLKGNFARLKRVSWSPITTRNPILTDHDQLTIEHLELGPGTGDSSSKIKKFLSSMGYIANCGCSLNTLILEFSCLSDSTDEDCSIVISYKEDAQKAVANIKVRDVIKIVAKSSMEGYCQQFDCFVGHIGATKQWAVTDDDQIMTKFARENFLSNNGAPSVVLVKNLEEASLGDVTFTRTWTLKPATAATKDKIPVNLAKVDKPKNRDSSFETET